MILRALPWVLVGLIGSIVAGCGPAGIPHIDPDAGSDGGDEGPRDGGSDAPLTSGVCGDGVRNVAEECDDGDTAPLDGCNTACGIEDGWSCDGASPSTCTRSCGDGVLDAGEGCDDGARGDGDGCSATCAIEIGWSCGGAPSACAPICGDGRRVGAEAEPGGCDDLGTEPGDGCSAECTIEPGWSCGGAPSGCFTGCGDGIVAGVEPCDDGDLAPGDGCSATCSVEDGWSCSGSPSACASICGDGRVRGIEGCDDDDADPGDGCSASCTVERGFSCAGEPSLCAPSCGDGIVVGTETCDDADTDPGDGCSERCETEFAFGCAGEPSTCFQVDRAIGVALGDAHGCAWTSERRVRCWGVNDDGQLGDGTLVSQALPITIAVYDVTWIDLGARFSCALRVDGTVWCWGSDSSQQQGPMVTGDRLVPAPVEGITGASAIATGGEHACALLEGGALTCWGDNDNRQLGRGGTATTDSDTPAVVAIGAAAIDVDLGEDHSCAVLGDGSIVCWGDDDNGQLGDGGTNTDQSLPVGAMLPAGVSAVEVSAGGNHTCARTDVGEVYCWGDNARGQLGVGGLDATTPVAVALPGPATAIRTGALHTCALVDGQPYCWGENVDAQLGDGTRAGGSAPELVSGLAGLTIGALATGERGTCALFSGTGGDDGRRVCWGEGDDGSLGILPLHERVLSTVALDATIGSLAATRSRRLAAYCAVVSGTVECWGNAETGLLMSTTGADPLVPTALPAPVDVTQIAMGEDFACALGASGVSCWGENGQHQLGQGASSIDSAWPTPVMSLPAGAIELAAGRFFACTRHDDGRVVCWGDGATRQVGIDATTDSGTPTAIPGVAGATAMCTGAGHGCAVVAGGEVRCWGSDDNGQLGDGSPGGARPDAQPVMGLGAASRVVCGDHHSCALLTDGTVWCWGDNALGQVGDGGTSDRSAPRQVVGLTGDAVAIFAGWEHTCAVHDTAAISCWGDDTDGQLGDGVIGGFATTARPVLGLASHAIDGNAASAGATCVRDAAGLRCVGFRGFAQLGDGTTLRPTVPMGAPL